MFGCFHGPIRALFLAGAVAAGCASATGGSPSNTGTHSSSSNSSASSATSASSSTNTSGGCPNPTSDAPYTVNGNKITGKSGSERLFRGLDNPGLEWGSNGGQNLQPFVYGAMSTAPWCANVVRVPLNQDFWLSDSPVYDSSYQSTVDTQVQAAEQNGMDIILDLHWSDRGDTTVMTKCGCTKSGSSSCTGNCQQPMADSRSLTFWQQVSMHYASDPQVLFELYNEPHDVPASVWLNGGSANGSSNDQSSSGSFTAVGMQQLYNAVHGAAPNNLVVIGGLAYAYDLSAVSGNLPTGSNILYATHPYKTRFTTPSTTDMENKFGFLTSSHPVIATEFGDITAGQPAGCDPSFDTSFIAFANMQGSPQPAHKVSWTAWAFFVPNSNPCGFPALISDYSSFTPNNAGMVVQAALTAGY